MGPGSGGLAVGDLLVAGLWEDAGSGGAPGAGRHTGSTSVPGGLTKDRQTGGRGGLQSRERPPAWEASWWRVPGVGIWGTEVWRPERGNRRHQGLPERKEISLKSSQGPAKRKRHCRKRATRPPRGTDTARALGSPRLPPRTCRTGSPSQAMAGPRLKRHSTPPGSRAPRVCMLLQ